MKVEESLNVIFDETHPPRKTSPLEDDELVEEEAIEKQIALAISTPEAEYVSSEKACQQALWIKQALIDYGVRTRIDLPRSLSSHLGKLGLDYLTKFDPKSYDGVFLGYSQNSRAYIILNKKTMKVEESLNVIFDETHPPRKTSPLEDDELVEDEAIE
nr:retrovirus-related Pol polyprotein from transposon TNT 1-94 [Tanacetum cinerariifolium]